MIDSNQGNIESWGNLSKESTVNLIERIVKSSDRLALNVLLETRRMFHLKGKPDLSLPGFLMELKDNLAAIDGQYTFRGSEFAECVYVLTLAKFSNFPDSSEKTSKSKKRSIKATGVDCRNTYRAFLKKMEELKRKGEIKGNLEEESEAGIQLQKLVYKHFRWSELECKRNTPFSIRYNWETEGVTISLWYPSYMNAKEFRAWLKDTIKDLNIKDRKREQQRIQSIIDKELRKGYQTSLDDIDRIRSISKQDEPLSIMHLEGVMFGRNLADAVAQEKVQNINRLRPAIKALGKKNLKRLILHIFSELEQEDYDLTRTAKEYGLSKSTLSRFAGSEWFEKMGADETIAIPDLWQNTAQVLAGNPIFMETVLESGYGGKLAEVLELINPG